MPEAEPSQQQAQQPKSYLSRRQTAASSTAAQHHGEDGPDWSLNNEQASGPANSACGGSLDGVFWGAEVQVVS